MPMKLEEVRGLLIQAMKKEGWNQISSLEIAVGDLKAKNLGLQKQPWASSDGRSFLETGESSLIHELVWTFIVQGILVPGLNTSNQSWPFLRLTDYGHACIKNEHILPHDPDGYLADFQSKVPGADLLIVEYTTEALQCFLRDLQRAAAVMLGAASEKTILVLIDSYADAISDVARQVQVRKEVARATSIFRKFGVFEKGFASIKSLLPRDISENTDSLMRGVFDLIRNCRNEAGHPASGYAISRDTNYSHLRLFIPYCQRVYELISWFKSNPI